VANCSTKLKGHLREKINMFFGAIQYRILHKKYFNTLHHEIIYDEEKKIIG